MPYIAQKLRPKYNVALDQIADIPTKGELEYCIYKLMMRFMKDKEKRYSNYHDMVYAAYHAGHEGKRRYLDKREDKAIEENGDITEESEIIHPVTEKRWKENALEIHKSVSVPLDKWLKMSKKKRMETICGKNNSKLKKVIKEHNEKAKKE